MDILKVSNNICYISGVGRCFKVPTMYCSHIPGLVKKNVSPFSNVLAFSFLCHFNTAPTTC